MSSIRTINTLFLPIVAYFSLGTTGKYLWPSTSEGLNSYEACVLFFKIYKHISNIYDPIKEISFTTIFGVF